MAKRVIPDMDKSIDKLDKDANTRVASQTPFEKSKRRRRRYYARTKDKLT
jgi:hypothetical protein